MKIIQVGIILFIVFVCSLQMKAQTVVRGQVISAESGEPIPAVNITIQNKKSTFWHGTSTDIKGWYSFNNLPAGNYLLKVTAVGYKAVRKKVELSPGEKMVFNLSLEAKTYKIDEIIVDAGYAGYTPGNPTTVQRISAEEIDRQDVASAADIARLLPASYVATNSRGQTILYLRNSVDRQTAQFFNGALLNVPWDNRVDLSFLPAAMLGGVTVSKGVPSIVYGTNTIGGAINFRPKTLYKPGSVTEISASAGYPVSTRASVLQMANYGSFSYTAEIGYTKQSDFALPAGANLPYSQPSNETRVNTDSRLFNLFFQGNYQFENNARLSASVFHIDAQKGVAPESNLNPQKTAVRYWRYPNIQYSMFILNGELPLDDNTRIYGSAWISRFTQDIYQYQTVNYKQLDATQNDLDYTAGLRMILEQRLGRGAIDIALNVLTTTHKQTNIAYVNGKPAPDSTIFFRQHIYSIGAEYSYPVSDNLTTMLSISYSGSAIVNTGPWESRGYEKDIKASIGVAAGFTYDLSKHVVLHAIGGRRPRFPTMREQYGGALGKFVPNPHLKPIIAYMGEIGVEWFGTTLSGSVTAFLNRFYNTIGKTTFQNGPNAGKEMRINLDGSRVWGIEVVAAAQPTRRLRIDGSITWMQIRALLNGNPRKLDEKPQWLALLTINYDLLSDFQVLLQAEYIGGVYTRTEQNTFVLLPDALIFDFRLSYNLSGDLLKNGQIFARVNNITDQLRLLQLGLPSPGRSFLTGIELTF